MDGTGRAQADRIRAALLCASLVARLIIVYPTRTPSTESDALAVTVAPRRRVNSRRTHSDVNIIFSVYIYI